MKTPKTLVAIAGVAWLASFSAHAQTWIQTGAPSNNWAAVACSADGAHLVAAAGGQFAGGQIYISSDAGTNWTSTSAPTLNWTSVASSADGTNLIACAYNAGVFTSADAGSTWTSNQIPVLRWFSVASSADGSQLYAAPYGNGVLYRSTNSGASWLTATNHLADLISIACSADGSLVLGGDTSAHVAVSTNFGVSWSTNTTLPHYYTVEVGSLNVSGAGQRLTAVLNGDAVFSSTNQGASWFSNSLPRNSSWIAAASSADGSRLIAAAQKSLVYSSLDAGATWTSNNAPALIWQALASSADGNLAFIISSKGGIWECRLTAPSRLAANGSPGSLSLSWLVPSSPLVLQQNPDLNPANWSDVTNLPGLDLRTLRQRLSLPANAPAGFYRLKSQ